jgi:hypothetical protein
MDNQNYKDLACKARDLYLLTQTMQKIMLQMFFDEFMDLDEKEEKLRNLQDDLPF